MISSFSKMRRKIYEFSTAAVTVLVGVLSINSSWIMDLIAKYIFVETSPDIAKSAFHYIQLGVVLHGMIFFYIGILADDSERRLVNVTKIINTSIDRVANRDITNILRRCGLLIEASKTMTVNFEVEETVYDLIRLVTNFIHKGEVKLNKTVSSPYYVYTLAASHDSVFLSIMKKYLAKIVSMIVCELEYYKNDHANESIDRYLLIVPYGRNVILADSVANVISTEDSLKTPILCSQVGAKMDSDERVDSLGEVEAYDLFYRTFVGCDALKTYVENECLLCNVQKIRLNAIVVDCNITGGETITKVVKRYNDLIRKLQHGGISFPLQDTPSLSIELLPIKTVATLFVASDLALTDDAENSLPKEFSKYHLSLWYYFVLPESIKEKIFTQLVPHKMTLSLKDVKGFVRDNPTAKKLKSKKWIRYNVGKFEDLIQRLM